MQGNEDLLSQALVWPEPLSHRWMTLYTISMWHCVGLNCLVYRHMTNVWLIYDIFSKVIHFYDFFKLFVRLFVCFCMLLIITDAFLSVPKLFFVEAVEAEKGRKNIIGIWHIKCNL